MVAKESAIQKELVRWLKLQHPDIEILYVKNEGKKNMLTAVEDKRMGLCAGWPDLTLFLNHNNQTFIFHLELKIIKGKLSTKQKEWWANLERTPNRTGCVAYGFIEAMKVVNDWKKKAADTSTDG